MIEREKPDAILPTLGGQTALNLAVELAASRGEWDRADRRRPRGDQARRGPRALPLDRARRRHPDAAQSIVAHSRRHRLPGAGDRAAGVHARRHRRRHRVDAERASRARSQQASTASPVDQVLVEEYLARLAGARARGDVRRARQRRRRLLDREPRPDGRPHRRLVDGRAAADAARPRSTSSCATRRSRPPARSASPPAARTSSSRCIPRAASTA